MIGASDEDPLSSFSAGRSGESCAPN